MLETQRQQLILDIVDEKKYVSVVELTELLNSSEATIRRDLVKLDKLKKIVKIRGGAQALNTGTASGRRHLAGDAFLVAKEQKAHIKQRIAQKAVELCQDGESIIINGGSSTFMMGQYLQERRLNILTNSFVLAHDLAERSNNQITLPGGEIYWKQGIILSAYEHDTIQYYTASKMFMGTPGFSEIGVTESDALLIRSEQKLRKQAEQLIVLADSSKLGKKSNFIFCPMHEVDILITDSGAPKELLDKFRLHGIEVIVVEIEY